MSIASHSYHLMKSGFRPSKSRVSRWESLAHQIIKRSEALKKESDDRLERYSLELRWRAKSGESLQKILPEAYALVRESAWRTLNMEHFPVQLMGGIASRLTSKAGWGLPISPVAIFSVETKGLPLFIINQIGTSRSKSDNLTYSMNKCKQ